MDTEAIIKVLDALVGPVEPQGMHERDKERYLNLLTLMDVTDILINRLLGISRMDERHEASVKKAGQRASEFLDELRMEL